MISLTKEERLVLVCLCLVLLLGISTNYFLKQNPITRNFFSATDSDMPSHLKLDINKVTYDELASIPHVGAQTAKNIIAYREENGSFTNLDELNNVPRMGKRKFQMIQKYLKVSPR
ncbi:MAG: helix-hairpin-helix domain-containing protein [Candidatus Omnitrophica bacterium]|nr:helix-hairpin-helix domain-containing protein [Candidatus Omnitrophota bacterium]